MKAIIYGPSRTLHLAEIDKPLPADDEVLIRVRSASVNPLDGHFVQTAPWLRSAMFKMLGARVNRPGADVAGDVEAVGRKVTQFAVGDAVFGASGGGAFAEYACAPETKLAKKPENVSYADAATLNVAGRTALQGLRDVAGLASGQKVLVNGASGGVGTFAIQIAKWLGAEVTAVCSTRNLDLVRGIGADHFIDHTRDDFAKGGDSYDVIFDLVGDRPLRSLAPVLSPNGGKWIGGGVLGVEASMLHMIAGIFNAPVMSLFSKHSFKTFIAKTSRGDLPELGKLLDAGTIKAVIDRTYALSEVPEAVRYIHSKRASGKVVIQIDH